MKRYTKMLEKGKFRKMWKNQNKNLEERFTKMFKNSKNALVQVAKKLTFVEFYNISKKKVRSR